MVPGCLVSTCATPGEAGERSFIVSSEGRHHLSCDHARIEAHQHVASGNLFCQLFLGHKHQNLPENVLNALPAWIILVCLEKAVVTTDQKEQETERWCSEQTEKVTPKKKIR